MHTKSFKTAPIAALVFLILTTSALVYAEDIFLNGVKVNGMTLQDFENAKVRFDNKGNVHITVPDVRVQYEGDKKTSGQVKAPAPRLSRTYWLVASQTNPGASQYNIDVHVNGQLVTRVRSSERRQVTMKLNKFLVPGKNTVVFTAIKDLGEARRSFSSNDELTLFVGEGAESGHQITINQTLARYTRTAADVENHTAKVTIVAQ